MYAATQAEVKETKKISAPAKAKPRTKTKSGSKSRSKKPKNASESAAAEVGTVLSWSYVVGLSLSAYEAVRRGCQGCWEVCWKSFGRGPLGQVLDWLAKSVGGVSGRVEL